MVLSIEEPKRNQRLFCQQFLPNRNPDTLTKPLVTLFRKVGQYRSYLSRGKGLDFTYLRLTILL